MIPTDAIVLASATENVPVARRFIRSWLSSIVDRSELIEDLELVTSELVTNAVEHAGDDRVEIAVDHDGSAVFIAVTSYGHADQLPPVETWQVAPADAVTGRGLGIVRSMVDTVDVRRVDGRVTVVVGRATA